MSSGLTPKSTVLDRYFAQVLTLPEYLRGFFGVELGDASSKDGCSLSSEDWQGLENTLVGCGSLASTGSSEHRSAVHIGDSASRSCDVSLQEAVQLAQLRLFAGCRSHRESQRNVLLKGYKRPDERLDSFRITEHGTPGLINLYPNSMVTRLILDKGWSYVYSRIGTDKFVWLLANTSLFVPIRGGGADGSCYVQLTGTGLCDVPRPFDHGSSRLVRTDAVSSNLSAVPKARRRRRKRGRSASAASAQEDNSRDSLGAAGLTASTTVPERLTALAAPTSTTLGKQRPFQRVESCISARSDPAAIVDDGRTGALAPRQTQSLAASRTLTEISFVRSRIFYARASRDKAGKVEIGIPSVHVFSRSALQKELDKVLPSSSSSMRSQPALTRVRKTHLSPVTSKGVQIKPEKMSSELSASKSPRADQTFAARRARHLSKYIFPRQYGLHNVFTGQRDFDASTHLFRDYTVRETEIRALGSRPTPPRLKSVLPLLAKMLNRHDRLNYRALLDRCCQTRLPKRRLTAEEKTRIVEDLAEQDLLAATQSSHLSQRSHLVTQISSHLTTAVDVNAGSLKKPRYTNYAVGSVGQVVRFVTLVVQSVLPRELLGSEHNLKLMLAWIGRFIRLRRYETFNLHQIFQSFRLSDVAWTLPRSSRAAGQRPNAAETAKRRELVLELLYWIYDSLVIPLIRTTFYVTESAAYRNRTLYFRQDDWCNISKPVLLHLRESIFEPISRAEALSTMSSRKLGYSHVRLLPKETGVRPIVNLRRRSTKQVQTNSRRHAQTATGSVNGAPQKSAADAIAAQAKAKEIGLGQSINYILQSAFHILTYEKNRLMDAGQARRNDSTTWSNRFSAEGISCATSRGLSSSVFGPNEIYAKLKQFKHQLGRSPTGGSSRLYFVKVDVRCAFDSIDQTKLLDIIEHILGRNGRTSSSAGYRIHRFAKIMPTGGNAIGSSKPRERNGSANGIGQFPFSDAHGTGTKREYAKVARPDDSHLDFFDLVGSLASALRNMIFVDSVVYRFEDSLRVLALLRQHVTENLVKIGKEFYRQRIGIPQGSSLSTLLCNFFYSDMEANSPSLSFLQNDNIRSRSKCSTLLRYTDDFLFVSTSKSQAKRFYDAMHRGHPQYGCFISPEKTLTNFDVLDKRSGVGASPFAARIRGRAFPWCGITIDTGDLGVETDLDRYRGVEIRDTLTVETGKRPGHAMVEKLLQSMKSRCHILFTDTALNGEVRVYRNIYTSFLVCAVKLVAYLGELKRFKHVFSASFLFRAIVKLVRFTGRYIATRAGAARSKVESQYSAPERQNPGPARRHRGCAEKPWQVRCAVQNVHIHWLGMAAFLAVVSGNTLAPSHASIGHDKVLNRGKGQMDPITRRELVRLLQEPVYRPSLARRRMLPIAQKALHAAKDVLEI